jgi:hypothetical protein
MTRQVSNLDNLLFQFNFLSLKSLSTDYALTKPTVWSKHTNRMKHMTWINTDHPTRPVRNHAENTLSWNVTHTIFHSWQTPWNSYEHPCCSVLTEHTTALPRTARINRYLRLISSTAGLTFLADLPRPCCTASAVTRNNHNTWPTWDRLDGSSGQELPCLLW